MKIAIVGAWHVHTMEYGEAVLQNPGAELVCLWDDEEARGKAAAEKLGIPFEPDLNKIWANPEIDGVQITTATCQHREVLLAAAAAGKHIFTEKVLAFTMEDAEEIAASVKSSGVKFTISYPHKTFPTLKSAKELVDSGRLGQITYARVRDAHNGSTAGWLPPHFYDAAQTGGGAMIDLGAHPMYTLNWFMGEPKSIVSMFTEVTHKGVEDNAVSVIEFANGAIGVSETGFVTNGMPYVLEMSGTKGSLMVHNDILEYSCEETGNRLVQKTDLPQPGTMPIDGWIAAVNEGGDAPNGIDDAVALTKFMVGAYEAYRTGRQYRF
ncbi:Gfo/Idh/MocA family protein [uncultured Neglectibacter sp.]|uniref:Gfo/Idh/MocA family protein n=1 Tax=uncultured Neglectibacter sp. TaxID=1924108 RepID=UPI0034DDE4F4